MTTAHELISANCTVTHDALRRWIELGWVLPAVDGEDVLFDPIDVARVGLIGELHVDLGIEEDSLTMVLSLLDQLYAVRRALSAVMSAIAAQPDDVRGRIATEVEARRTTFVATPE